MDKQIRESEKEKVDTKTRIRDKQIREKEKERKEHTERLGARINR